MSQSAPNGARHRYVLGLGSNLGDRRAYLEAALARIQERIGPLLARSPWYETAPVGAADQTFVNGAALVASALDPDAVLAALLAIEAELGRVRRERWGNRTVDLDVLLWLPAGAADADAAASFASPSLTIPHPHLLERDFALVPAADAAPDIRHPATGRSLRAEVAARGYALIPARD
jgi:2-amino-4-hydroxy-6-hydroxymethyldihydropteridine diphosphokinase